MTTVSAAGGGRPGGPRLRLGALLLVSRVASAVLGVVLFVGCHSAKLASRPRFQLACPLPASAAACPEPIPLCSRNVRRASDGVAVVDGGSVYRISELVQHRGAQWRAGSVAILCNPRFRGTLMREVRCHKRSEPSGSSTAYMHYMHPCITCSDIHPQHRAKPPAVLTATELVW